MNLTLYTSLSVLVTAACLGSGYSQTGDPWEALRGMFRHKLNILVLVNLAYNILFLFGKGIQKLFFGTLRDVETQNLNDRLLTYILFKIVFVGAVMSQPPQGEEPDLRDLLILTIWFSILGFLKIFTLLCRDRFEYLNTFSPNTHPAIHLRILSLLVLILFVDLWWFYMCVRVFNEVGLSQLLLLNFECFTIFLDTIQTLIKYAIHLLDLSRTGGVWEQRGQYIYFTEFATDSLVLAGTLGHYMHILYLHGISVTLLDAVIFMHMRIVFNNLRDKIVAYRNYRKLADNMDHMYPSVTAEELAQYNDDCAICRETMDTAKKLPCGHLFHHSCLRSWLEQHHSCPTCRRSLIDPAPPTGNGAAGPSQQPHQQQHQPGPAGQPPNNFPQQQQQQPGNAPMMRFSSGFLGWLPSFSVEVVRRPHGGMRHMAPMGQWGNVFNTNNNANNNPQLQEMIRAVQDIFPHVPPNIIAQDLAMTHSVEVTTENILEGRVFIPPQPETPPPTRSQPPPQPVPQQPQPQPQQQAQPQPQAPTTPSVPSTPTSTYSTPSTPSTPSAPSTPSSSSTPSSPSSTQNAVLSKYSDKFATDASTRKASLQARKQAMLEAARKHYLDAVVKQDEPSSPAPTTPAPAAPLSPATPLSSSSAFMQSSSSSSSSLQPQQPQQTHQQQQTQQQQQQQQPQPQPTQTQQVQQAPLSPLPESAEERRRLLLEAAQRRFNS